MKFTSGFMFSILLITLPAGPAWPAAGDGKVPLTLNQAVDLALSNNPAVRENESMRAEAAGALDEAGSGKRVRVRLESRLTHLGGGYEMGIVTGAPPLKFQDEDTWVTALTADKVIYSGGRIEALVRRAQNSLLVTGATAERALQQVVFEAEVAFMMLLAAQNRTEAAGLALEAAEGHLEEARSRYESRAAARFDVLRAEVQVEEARRDLIQAGADKRIADSGLLRAVGLKEGEFIAVAPEEGEKLMPMLDELLGQARSARPEIAAFKWQEEAALAEVDAASAERLPSFSIGGDYQYADPESPVQFSRWSVSALMTVPIMDGGRSKARKAEAKARYDGIMAARERVILQIESEVRDACASLISADTEVETAQKLIEQAEELHRIAGVRYQNGVGTATETADALASLSRARQGLVAATAARGIAEARLRFAVGTPVAPALSTVEEVLP